MNVLRNVYNCERFAGEVFGINRSRNIYLCKCIFSLLLELRRMENDLYLGCTEEKNILYHLIFVCVPQGAQWAFYYLFNDIVSTDFVFFLLSTETAQFLSSPHLYDEIVEMSALLFLRAMSNESLFSICENLLCQGILDNDAIRGHLCLDIWRLFVRYVEVCNPLCFTMTRI